MVLDILLCDGLSLPRSQIFRPATSDFSSGAPKEQSSHNLLPHLCDFALLGAAWLRANQTKKAS
jgi:hypothetical protein